MCTGLQASAWVRNLQAIYHINNMQGRARCNVWHAERVQPWWPPWCESQRMLPAMRKKIEEWSSLRICCLASALQVGLWYH